MGNTPRLLTCWQSRVLHIKSRRAENGGGMLQSTAGTDIAAPGVFYTVSEALRQLSDSPGFCKAAGLTVNDYTISICCLPDKFLVFDSHRRSDQGLLCSHGKAAMIEFFSIDALQEYIVLVFGDHRYSLTELVLTSSNPRILEDVIVDEQRDLAEHEEAVDNDSEVFEVECIVGERIHRGVLQYRVRWARFGPGADTWTPVADLQSCQEAVNEYLAKKQTTITRSGRRINRPSSLIADFEELA